MSRETLEIWKNLTNLELVFEYIQVFKRPACSGILVSRSNEKDILLFYYMSSSCSGNTPFVVSLLLFVSLVRVKIMVNK